jgi:hypothetical protein
MRDKHRDWSSSDRPHCRGYPDALSCGCGVSQEEIDVAYAKAEAKAKPESGAPPPLEPVTYQLSLNSQQGIQLLMIAIDSLAFMDQRGGTFSYPRNARENLVKEIIVAQGDLRQLPPELTSRFKVIPDEKAKA